MSVIKTVNEIPHANCNESGAQERSKRTEATGVKAVHRSDDDDVFHKIDPSMLDSDEDKRKRDAFNATVPLPPLREFPKNFEEPHCEIVKYHSPDS